MISPESPIIRQARCACGQVNVTATGNPVRISACHCLDCQRRTGSAFAAQARFTTDQVEVMGETRSYQRVADSGNRITFNFCPGCGATVTYTLASDPGVIAIPLGAFADPDFPAPSISFYEARKHAWVGLTGEIEHCD